MAGTTGLEPATPGSTVQYSNQLSYVPLKQCKIKKSTLVAFCFHFELLIFNFELYFMGVRGVEPRTPSL